MKWLINFVNLFGCRVDISVRIKILRGDLPQDAFARMIGVHKNTVGRWERSERAPDVIDLNNLLNAFPDISPAWLLTGEEPMKRGKPSTVSASASLDEQLLVGIIEAVDEYLDQVKGRLAPAKKAQLVATLYEMFSAGEVKKVDKATVIRLVKLAA